MLEIRSLVVAVGVSLLVSLPGFADDAFPEFSRCIGLELEKRTLYVELTVCANQDACAEPRPDRLQAMLQHDVKLRCAARQQERCLFGTDAIRCLSDFIALLDVLIDDQRTRLDVDAVEDFVQELPGFRALRAKEALAQMVAQSPWDLDTPEGCGQVVDAYETGFELPDGLLCQAMRASMIWVEEGRLTQQVEAAGEHR